MPSRGKLRHRLSLVTALVALALALLAPHAAARLAYTANLDSQTVSVIDTATNQAVGAPILVDGQPTDIAITPDGRTAYVPALGGKLTAIDTATNEPKATIALVTGGLGIAISPDGTSGYIAINDDQLQVVDLRTNQISGAPIVVGENVQQVAFSPDGRSAYLTDAGRNAVHVIDTQSRQVVGTPIPVGPSPGNVTFTPDGRTAFVLDQGNGSLYAIDTQTRQVTEIPVLPGEPLYGLAIAPDGKRAYVSAQFADAVLAVDLQTRQVVGPPIAAGDEPYEIAITSDGRTAYVANDAGKSVTAIDTATHQVRTTIPIAGEPLQLAIVPNQSPVASFTARPSKSATRVKFNGSRSTDPDGTVSIFNWGFGDRTAAANAGPTPSHTYRMGGIFTASLNVIDNEGCSTAQVFTGSTAYCSGSPVAAQMITVAPNRFKFGPLTRNAKKGTAKLRVRVPTAGTLVLSGKKVKRAQRSAGKGGVVVLAIRPKAKLRRALESKGRAKAKVRVTFRPTGGQPSSKGRSIQLALR